MAGIITYPWARPQGYNPKLKLKKRKKENNKQATSLTTCPRDDRMKSDLV
jgi:hypothetical protein